jgi:hypothetical protein
LFFCDKFLRIHLSTKELGVAAHTYHSQLSWGRRITVQSGLDKKQHPFSKIISFYWLIITPF